MDRNVKDQAKRWTKPELVVLVRSNPQEAVLAGCKMSTTVVGGGNQACKKSGKVCIASQRRHRSPFDHLWLGALMAGPSWVRWTDAVSALVPPVRTRRRTVLGIEDPDVSRATDRERSGVSIVNHASLNLRLRALRGCGGARDRRRRHSRSAHVWHRRCGGRVVHAQRCGPGDLAAVGRPAKPEGCRDRVIRHVPSPPPARSRGT